jgi:hypothetical protein
LAELAGDGEEALWDQAAASLANLKETFEDCGRDAEPEPVLADRTVGPSTRS